MVNEYVLFVGKLLVWEESRTCCVASPTTDYLSTSSISAEGTKHEYISSNELKILETRNSLSYALKQTILILEQLMLVFIDQLIRLLIVAVS